MTRRFEIHPYWSNHGIGLTDLLFHTYEQKPDWFRTTTKCVWDFSSFPHVDIRKEKDDHGNLTGYEISMALAGYAPEDLRISFMPGSLFVESKTGETESCCESEDSCGCSTVTDFSDVIHKGIARRSFRKRFTLHKSLRISSCTMENGLLVVSLEREIPVEETPQEVEIN